MSAGKNEEGDRLWAYYERNPVFRWMVAPGRWGWVKFTGVMLVLAAGALLVCWQQDALWLAEKEENQHLDAKGLFEDVVMGALLFTLPAGVILLRNLFQKLEELFDELPNMVEATEFDRVRRGVVERVSVESEADEIRNFVQLGTRESRRWYLASLGFLFLLVMVFQIAMPLMGASAENPTWSLWPQA